MAQWNSKEKNTSFSFDEKALESSKNKEEDKTIFEILLIKN